MIAVAGPDNDNYNNDKDDDDDIALSSAISLGLATSVSGARSFANPRDLVVATIVLQHCPREHDLSESRDISVTSMMRHRPCKRNLPESRNISVANLIFRNFVVFRATNLVMLDLCVVSP